MKHKIRWDILQLVNETLFTLVQIVSEKENLKKNLHLHTISIIIISLLVTFTSNLLHLVHLGMY